jgi:AraC-like DNA-binding protein
MRMILSYILVGLILVCLLSYAIFGKVTAELKKDIYTSLQKKTEQAGVTAEVLVSSTYKYISQVFGNNTNIDYAIYGSDFTMLDINQISTVLNNLKASNPLIRSIYIYNLGQGVVFTSDSTMQPLNQFADQGMTAMLENGDFRSYDRFIPRTVHLSEKGSTSDLNLISVVYTAFPQEKRPAGAMVLNLDENVLRQLIMKNTGSSSIRSQIVDHSGVIISDTDAGMIGHNLGGQSYKQMIDAQKDAEGFFIDIIQGKRYLVTYVKNNPLGWTFIGMEENENLLFQVGILKRFIFWMTVLICMAAIMLALLSIQLIYTPLYRIIKKIGNQPMEDGQQSALNEYSILSAMESRFKELKGSVLPAKKREVLHAIVHGTYKSDGRDKMDLLKLDIKLTADEFQVCIIRLDNYRELIVQHGTSDVLLYKYAISNIVSELVSPHMPVETLDDNGDAVIAILAPNVPEQSEVASLMARISECVRHYLKLSVSITMGSVVQGLQQIRYSWNQANQASRYRLIHGAGSIIHYSEEADRHGIKGEYPYALEKEIIGALKAGNALEMSRTVDAFFLEVSRNHYDEMMLYMAQLMVMTVRTAEGMILDNELFLSEVRSLVEQLDWWETLGQIKAKYMQVCGEIIDIRDSEASQKNVKAAEIIQAIIRRDYGNPALSVDMLAEQVNLSSSHARKVFKEQTGTTISQYITNVRFEKAQEMLLHSDEPANKIGEAVGFANPNYFYLSFKKYTGKTPASFRKEAKYKQKQANWSDSLSDSGASKPTL